MQLITRPSDLKAISGGYYAYSYDEFVTADTIFNQSLINAIFVGGAFGLLGGCLGSIAAGTPGAVLLGSLCAAGGGYFGFNYNDYSDIEPNTWVHWNVYIEYY